MSDDTLVLLHLSDIHLRRIDIEGEQDLDQDLRNEVLRDITEHVLPDVGRIDAILITGDVAFAGEAVEYESAKSWLGVLCDSIGCERASVWAVPGNHDVDRSVVSKSQMLQDIHSALRGVGADTEEVRKRLRDPTLLENLLSPLTTYNTEFADAFECATRSPSIVWNNPLQLNGQYRLVLRGINSALVSDATDNDAQCRMVIGLRQVQLPREPGVIYATLAHHPPDWWLDNDDVRTHLNNRAALQLYGHKHDYAVRKLDNSIQIFAGALHPERGEAGWEPRYNVIRLHVEEGTKLSVQIFSRVWKRQHTAFARDYGPNESYPRQEWITLQVPQTEVSAAGASKGAPPSPAPAASTMAPPSNQPVDDVDPPRELVYRFFQLQYAERMRLLVQLGLLEDEDRGVPDAELIHRAIRRARQQGRLSELAETLQNLRDE